jgi:PAS domain S-box-containing protein
VIDADTRKIVEVNETGLTLIGLAKEQVVGSVCHRFVCPAEKKNCPVLDLGKDIDLSEKILLTADGKQKDIIKTVVPITRHGHRYLIESFVDISARKRAEEELKKRNQYIESILDNMPIGFAANTIDDGVAIYMNDNFTNIYGWPKETFTDVDRFFASVYPGPEGQELKARIIGDMRSGDAERMAWDDLKITARSGGCRYISARNIPIPEQNLMISTVWDTTRMHESQEALRCAEARYRLLFEQSADGIVIIDTETLGILEFNETAHRQLGYSREEFARLRITDIEAVESAAEIEAQIERARREGLNEFETLQRTRQGFRRNVLVRAQFAMIGGQPLFHCVWRDITERKRAERALHESMEAFRGYFNMGTVGMCVTSLEKGWIEVNDCLCRMLGYSREELGGRSWADLTYPDDENADRDLFNQVLAGQRDSYELEKRFVRKDGQVIHTKLYATCQRNPDGTVHHFLASLVDISEQKRAERERPLLQEIAQGRSEERRVGKECRSRWSPYH